MPAMSAADARQAIADELVVGSTVGLLSAQIDRLVALSARQDAAGYAPSDADWTPTYEPLYGALRGVQMQKKMIAETAIDFDAAGGRYQASQVIGHIDGLIADLRRRLACSYTMVDPTYEDSDVVL